jgi:hypothetical protein
LYLFHSPTSLIDIPHQSSSSTLQYLSHSLAPRLPSDNTMREATEKLEMQAPECRADSKPPKPNAEIQAQLLIQHLNDTWSLGLPLVNSIFPGNSTGSSLEEDISSDIMSLCSLEMVQIPFQLFESEAKRLCTEWAIPEVARNSLPLERRTELSHCLRGMLGVVIRRHMDTVSAEPNLASESSRLNPTAPTFRLPTHPPSSQPADLETHLALAHSQGSDPTSSTLSGGVQEQYSRDAAADGLSKSAADTAISPTEDTLEKSLQERLNTVFRELLFQSSESSLTSHKL